MWLQLQSTRSYSLVITTNSGPAWGMTDLWGKAVKAVKLLSRYRVLAPPATTTRNPK